MFNNKYRIYQYLFMDGHVNARVEKLKLVTRLQIFMRRHLQVSLPLYHFGSIQHDTDVKQSDIDCYVDCRESNILDRLASALAGHGHEIGICSFQNRRNAKVPIIVIETHQGLKMDISKAASGREGQNFGHFIGHILKQRPDLSIYIRILKRICIKWKTYGGANGYIGGIGWTIIVLNCFQLFQELPPLDRISDGNYTKQYWELQRHQLEKCRPEYYEDTRVIQNLFEILKFLVAHKMRLEFCIQGLPSKPYCSKDLAICTSMDTLKWVVIKDGKRQAIHNALAEALELLKYHQNALFDAI